MEAQSIEHGDAESVEALPNPLIETPPLLIKRAKKRRIRVRVLICPIQFWISERPHFQNSSQELNFRSTIFLILEMPPRN